MITPFEIYAITQLDSIISFFGNVSIALFAVTIVLYIVYCFIKIESSEEEEIEKCNKVQKKFVTFLLVPFIFYLLYSIIPSTNQAAAMFVIPKIANSDFAKEAQNLPVDLTKLAEKYIKEKLNDNQEGKK